MIQPGFFDLQDRLQKIDRNGDLLAKTDETADWELFRPALEKARDKGRQSSAGPKGYDAVLPVKILVLQSLCNLSDGATEFQILDRRSFRACLLEMHSCRLRGVRRKNSIFLQSSESEFQRPMATVRDKNFSTGIPIKLV